jgi:SNF2 family DNA or RNA helicase
VSATVLATVHAELAADGRTVILMASGAPEEIANAARYLGTLTPHFDATDPPGAMHFPISWPAIVQLAKTYGEAWRTGPRLTEWVARQVVTRTTMAINGHDYAALNQPPPAGLIPRPYQVAGAHLIARSSAGRSIVTDEPGTGKTITTILGLVERAYDGQTPWPVLCVAPASVVDSWVKEWRKWAPHLSVVTYRGTPDRRRSMAAAQPKAHVYVCSYDIATRDAPPGKPRASQSPLLTMGFRALVVDECHLIKSRKAMRSLAVRRIADSVHKTGWAEGREGGTVIGLSGTPITHHAGNLWPILRALEPDAYPAGERFDDRYLWVAGSEYGQDEVLGLNPSTEPEFRMTLLGAHRRVAKADVLDQLPPKIYTVRTVEIPPKYRAVYDSMEADMLAELESEDGSTVELSVMSVLAQLTRLSQLACAAADIRTQVVTRTHARDYEVTSPIVVQSLAEVGIYGPWKAGDTYERTETNVTLKAPSWKVDALLEVLDEREDPCVVFAPSRQLIMLAGDAIAKTGRRVGYIVGEQTPKQRTAMIDSFQAGQLDVICATTQAGGVGITLTAGRTVIFLQRPWSIVESLQAEDRCHRIGSERYDSIEIVDIVAASTIDTRVREVLREKAGALADLVQDRRIVTEILGGKNVQRVQALAGAPA